MIGPRQVLVTPDSATQGTLPDRTRRNHAIDCSHSDMVKFPHRRYPAYQTLKLDLLGLLRSWQNDIDEGPGN